MRKDKLVTEAESVGKDVRAVFPDVLLDSDIPVGFLRRRQIGKGEAEYYWIADEANAEIFFRSLTDGEFYGGSTTEYRTVQDRILAGKYPPKRWTDLIGEPFYPWIADEYSHLPLSPQALAYYLPAYMLTALPFLVDLPFLQDREIERRDAGAAHAAVHALTPPEGLDVWNALKTLPPEALDPHNRYMFEISNEERFLRFVGQFKDVQRAAIGRFVDFVCKTYFADPQPFEKDRIAALRRCWMDGARRKS